MTVDEAIELGKRAIMHAVHRDSDSGGVNNGKCLHLNNIIYLPSRL